LTVPGYATSGCRSAGVIGRIPFVRESVLVLVGEYSCSTGEPGEYPCSFDVLF